MIGYKKGGILTTSLHNPFQSKKVANKYDLFYHKPVGMIIDALEKLSLMELMLYNSPLQSLLLEKEKNFCTFYTSLINYILYSIFDSDFPSFPPLLKTPSPLLEIGAGTGHWSEFFSLLGFSVIGIDLSKEMLSVAESKKIPNSQWIHGDAYDLLDPSSPSSLHLSRAFSHLTSPLKKDGTHKDTSPQFSFISFITSLEFLLRKKEDLLSFVKSLSSYLHPKGSFIFGLLNPLSPTLKKKMNTPSSLYSDALLFRPKEFRELLEPLGDVFLLPTIFYSEEDLKKIIEMYYALFFGISNNDSMILNKKTSIKDLIIALLIEEIEQRNMCSEEFIKKFHKQKFILRSLKNYYSSFPSYKKESMFYSALFIPKTIMDS